eukprot:Colp12_sorted_trinity150504_noHs@7288
MELRRSARAAAAAKKVIEATTAQEATKSKPKKEKILKDVEKMQEKPMSFENEKPGIEGAGSGKDVKKRKVEEEGTQTIAKKVKVKKEEKVDEDGRTSIIPKRNAHGELVFPDHPEFRPNLTPKQVIQMGSFGGTYFRNIKSAVTDESYRDAWKEFPEDWFEGLDIKRQVASQTYDCGVNKYKVKCGQTLDFWQDSKWIAAQDPYGWFQWYCRFYLGRRSPDDKRQISRGLGVMGPGGRFKNNLIGQIARKRSTYDDVSISPVIRQTLQHWAYQLTQRDFEKYAKKKGLI